MGHTAPSLRQSDPHLPKPQNLPTAHGDVQGRGTGGVSIEKSQIREIPQFKTTWGHPQIGCLGDKRGRWGEFMN